MQIKGGIAKKMIKTNTTVSQITLYAICIAFVVFCFSLITATIDESRVLPIIPKLVLGLVSAIVSIILVIICFYISKKLLSK